MVKSNRQKKSWLKNRIGIDKFGIGFDKFDVELELTKRIEIF